MIVSIEFKKQPLYFKDPVSLIATRDPAVLRECFARMEDALRAGYYLAGFLSYEAGYCFESRLQENKPYDFPLVCMGVYKAPAHGVPRISESSQKPVLRNLHLNISREKYFSNIETIRSHIAQGDVYQITYCIKLLFDCVEDPYQLYSYLRKAQPVPYPAFIQTDEFAILSLSPEKFMKKSGGDIVTKPMKGTWMRGENFFSDYAQRLLFARDKKNRAENVMIADLLRNDLGRIGTAVRAPRLFEVAGYRTLFQMTSTVRACVPEDILLYDLFAALFPSGSVTGAPKIRAMEIVKSLEAQERHIYTGAIGYITPRKDLFFNIPIRTILLRKGKGEMGIGGGIVWDSTAQGEWDEGLLKARFVTDLYGGQEFTSAV